MRLRHRWLRVHPVLGVVAARQASASGVSIGVWAVALTRRLFPQDSRLVIRTCTALLTNTATPRILCFRSSIRGMRLGPFARNCRPGQPARARRATAARRRFTNKRTSAARGLDPLRRARHPARRLDLGAVVVIDRHLLVDAHTNRIEVRPTPSSRRRWRPAPTPPPLLLLLFCAAAAAAAAALAISERPAFTPSGIRRSRCRSHRR